MLSEQLKSEINNLADRITSLEYKTNMNNQKAESIKCDLENRINCLENNFKVYTIDFEKNTVDDIEDLNCRVKKIKEFLDRIEWCLLTMFSDSARVKHLLKED